MDVDLNTFVASDALKNREPLSPQCNCGRIVAIFPPLAPAAKAGSRSIKANTTQPILIPVQGSYEKTKNLTAAERERLLNQIREKL
jgi:hypothetical protein